MIMNSYQYVINNLHFIIFLLHIKFVRMWAVIFNSYSNLYLYVFVTFMKIEYKIALLNIRLLHNKIYRRKFRMINIIGNSFLY